MEDGPHPHQSIKWQTHYWGSGHTTIQKQRKGLTWEGWKMYFSFVSHSETVAKDLKDLPG